MVHMSILILFQITAEKRTKQMRFRESKRENTRTVSLNSMITSVALPHAYWRFTWRKTNLHFTSPFQGFFITPRRITLDIFLRPHNRRSAHCVLNEMYKGPVTIRQFIMHSSLRLRRTAELSGGSLTQTVFILPTERSFRSRGGLHFT